MKHTKGPWTAEFTNVYIVDADRNNWELLADCVGNNTIDYPTAKANACLIAQAPAMYDQLASARAIMQKFGAFMDEYYSIRGVIEPVRSDSREDTLLKDAYAEMKQWMEDE